MLLKNSQNLHESTCATDSCKNKVATLIKKILAQVSLRILRDFLGHLFTEHLWSTASSSWNVIYVIAICLFDWHTMFLLGNDWSRNWDTGCFESTHRGALHTKSVFKIFPKFTGKQLCQGFFSGMRPATLLKKTLWHRFFLANFTKFLRKPFLQNPFGRRLLVFQAHL